MNEKSEDGRTKAQIVESMINEITNIDLPEIDKEAVDICILVFDDDCRVLIDWIPLSEFHGGVKLNTGRQCVLGSAVISSINKIRERRKLYCKSGVDASRKAQIFVYTDGKSTEDLTIAYQRSAEYLDRFCPYAKMHIILIRPSVDATELIGFGEKITILREIDCVNGLPGGFRFLQDYFIADDADDLSAERINTSIPAYLFVLTTFAKQDDKDYKGYMVKDSDFDWDDEKPLEILDSYKRYIHPKSPMEIHVPLVLCIDTSSSMNDVSADGKSKKQIIEEMINGFSALPLTDYDKQCIDICILVFDDEVRTLVEWRPLTDFSGGIKLDCAGTTALGSAIKGAIDKSQERRHDYMLSGIKFTRPFIFVYTDGYSTESLEDVYRVSNDYFAKRKAKMFITMLPPLRDCFELKAFGDKITIFRATDSIDIRSSFNFIQKCITCYFGARQIDNTRINIPNNLDVLNRKGKDDIMMENGQKFFKLNHHRSGTSVL